MNLNIRELEIIIAALNLVSFETESSQTIQHLESRLNNELGDLKAEAHAEAASELGGTIMAACKWANDEAVMEYCLEWASQPEAGVDHFKKSLLG